MLPSPRQTGFIIGNSIAHMPLGKLVGAHNEEILTSAGIERQRLLDELTLLAAAASLHAIETAGMSPDSENDAAAGLYDWMRQQSDPTGAFLVENVEVALEAYVQAAKDDLNATKDSGRFTEVELEFIERLLALGEETEERARSCCELGAAVPVTLWQVIQESATSVLVKAQLVRTSGA